MHEETFEDIVKHKIDEDKRYKEQKEEARKKAQIFYQKPITLVYTTQSESVAEYFLGVLTEFRNKIGNHLPVPSRCEIKEYLKRREEFERTGTHVIMIGDSAEAKKLYKNAKNGRWDYYNLGMRYMSYGNKTVLLARRLKDDEIDEFVSLARKVNEKYPISIPSNVKSVEYTFLKEVFSDLFGPQEDRAVGIITTIIGSPLIVFGQALEGILNTIQTSKNVVAAKKLDFLQYCIAIYMYLDSEEAIVE